MEFIYMDFVYRDLDGILILKLYKIVSLEKQLIYYLSCIVELQELSR